MIVVSNASPLIHLARAGRLIILRELYGQVRIPPAVHRELLARPVGTELDAALAADGWIRVEAVRDQARVTELMKELGGAGEAEALALAVESPANAVLLDERKARRAAARLNLPVVPTIACLVAAKLRGLIPSVREEMNRLRATGFWLDDATEVRALEAAGEQPPEEAGGTS